MGAADGADDSDARRRPSHPRHPRLPFPNFQKSATLKNNTVDVVGLGLNAMDTICIVPAFPQPNTKTAMREVRVEPGGQMATALTTCVRLGLTARYIGSIGTDSWGKAQLASLREENLELNVHE